MVLIYKTILYALIVFWKPTPCWPIYYCSSHGWGQKYKYTTPNNNANQVVFPQDDFDTTTSPIRPRAMTYPIPVGILSFTNLSTNIWKNYLQISQTTVWNSIIRINQACLDSTKHFPFSRPSSSNHSFRTNPLVQVQEKMDQPPAHHLSLWMLSGFFATWGILSALVSKIKTYRNLGFLNTFSGLNTLLLLNKI